jgi:hypothetical protein
MTIAPGAIGEFRLRRALHPHWRSQMPSIRQDRRGMVPDDVAGAPESMAHERHDTDHPPARIAAALGMICLVLALASAAPALDPGDGSRVSTQQLRDPTAQDPGPIKLPVAERKGGSPADKAELSVYQTYAMYFGTLVDNDGYVVLGTGDAITQDPDHLVYGGVPQSAEIRLSGDPFVSVSVDFTAGSATGFSLSQFETDYGTPPLSGLTLDAAGVLTLHVGARLQLLASSVSAGSGQQIGYTISALYE